MLRKRNDNVEQKEFVDLVAKCARAEGILPHEVAECAR